MFISSSEHLLQSLLTLDLIISTRYLHALTKPLPTQCLHVLTEPHHNHICLIIFKLLPTFWHKIFVLPLVFFILCYRVTTETNINQLHLQETTLMAPMVSEAIKLLLYISIFTTLSTCSPITPHTKRHTVNDILPNRKRQDGLFSVLGVGGLTGTDSHPRLEIRELEKNEDQWNVYLLGLRRFQSVDQNDKLSYYQISGMFFLGSISFSFLRLQDLKRV